MVRRGETLAKPIGGSEAVDIESLATQGEGVSAGATEALYDMAKLASVYFEFPIAAVALCQATGVRFEVVVGASSEGLNEAVTFGEFALEAKGGVFVVKDASRDPRFLSADAEFRFFASSRLIGDDDVPVGLICLLDRRPRPFSEDQERMLALFGRQAANHLALDRAATRLQLCAERLERTQRAVRVGTWEFDFGTNLITWSQEMFGIYGVEPHQGVPKYEELLQLHTPESRLILHENVVSAIKKGGTYELELELLVPGGVRRVIAKGETILDSGGLPKRLVGTVRLSTPTAA